ncbi:MAG: radical SAM protein, partial [Chloroflexi bacterium]|nr:radical SAM protein [Chloroflexota bacterium]
MAKSIYLVNPMSDYPSYYGGEVYAGTGLGATTTIADLAIPTVAAMVPQDFEIDMVDQYVAEVDFDHPAEIIGITGKITQFGNMKKIATEFRERGKTVLIGGPYASLSPDMVRPYADILVEGEMEEIAEEIFEDIRAGKPKDYYKGTRPDLRTSPLPRWDMYPNHRAQTGSVQTSRGCPFECDFCDVIQYLGRKQRHKDPDQAIKELEQLYNFGYRVVFLADDNFTAHRRKAREMLEALAEWNNNREERMSFYTQLSIDITKDEEMLALCAEAGMTSVFIGIETPNEESLKLSKKRQNLGVSLEDRIQMFTDYGIMVMAGQIVGFDGDDHSIFDRQYRFAMSTTAPIFTLGALVAPAATPLFDRMDREGRLIESGEGKETIGNPWNTNIVPANMTREELMEGIKWLANNIYAPQSFGDRLIRFAETFGQRVDKKTLERRRVANQELRPVDMDATKLVRRFARSGPEEAKVWAKLGKIVARKPEVGRSVMWAIAMYMQIRHMY